MCVSAGVAKRMEWLLELMGHIRNVAYGATTVKCDSITEVFYTHTHIKQCSATSHKAGLVWLDVLSFLVPSQPQRVDGEDV